MREIRFRAWDKLQKLMLYQSDCHNNPDDKCLMLTLDGRLLDTAFDRNDDETDSCILMQYTGLKDRDGKEIYEGDILKFPDAYEYKLVIFDDKANIIGFYLSCYENFNKSIKRRVLPCNNLTTGDHFIAGNIHENPELLSEGNK